MVESDVFEDFASDSSDLDDEEWNFTEGESASVLTLIGDASPITTKAAANMVKNTENSAVKVEKIAVECSDEELLDELFPEQKTELSGEKKCAKKMCQGRRGSDCEVEWALMALEEPEQVTRSGRDVAPMKKEEDFVSLFEEMYGGDSAIALSTPSPPNGNVSKDADRFKMGTAYQRGAEEKEGCSPVKFADTSAKEIITESIETAPQSVESPLKSVETSMKPIETHSKLVENIPVCIAEQFPVEAFDMLRLVYDKAMTAGNGILPFVQHASKTLCLPDDFWKTLCVEPVCSLAQFAKMVCALEENLCHHQFTHSVASSREERLELVLAALDDQLNILPYNWRIKWTKAIAMMTLVAKTQGQSISADISTPQDDKPPALRIDTSVSPVSLTQDNTKRKQGSPLDGWATFHPEKMPVRRNELVKSMNFRSKQPGHQSSTIKKTRVVIHQYRPAKLRVRCRVYNPEENELTFRPTINKKYLRRQKGKQTADFAVRMQKDISQRRLQILRQEEERAQQEQEEAEKALAASLVAKGSQRILLKNGMWSESLEERISRLAVHRTNTKADDSRPKRKHRQKQHKRKLQAAEVASRACEALYQRGIEQRRREEERVQEDILDIEHQRNRPKMSDRSLCVMKARIRQDLCELCMDSRRSTAKTEVVDTDETSDSENQSGRGNSFRLTFIDFSCALLYFGFVPDLNTPWEGSSSTSDGNGSEFTLLWHSWTVFTRESTGVAGPILARKVFERILFAVILGERIGDHFRFQSRKVQTLLRVYRTNYYARKHSPLKVERSDYKEDRQVMTRDTGRAQTSKHRRGRVHYSLHGKPIQSSDVAATDLLSERERLLHEKIDQMREEKARQELEGCTFRPHISPRPSHDNDHQSVHEEVQSTSLKKVSSTVPTFERLYSDAFQRQNNVLEKYLEAKSHREELEKRECRVHPSYVNGLTIEERLKNLHVALASNSIPVDYHKKIDAMRTATEMKALDEQSKAQRLLPAHFKRAKDGRTIVLPFRFATEIRAAMGTELKKKRVQVAHQPRNQLMKGLRPLGEARQQEALAPVADRDEADIGEEAIADICLDVHLSPSETHQLCLNSYDDPREAVSRFAQHFALSKTQRHFLLQLVEARLEQLADYQTK